MKLEFIQELEKNKNKFKLLILPLISSAAVLRKQKLLIKLLESAKRQKISSRKIYETLLQTYLFAGFPSALISLKIASQFFTFGKFRRNQYDPRKVNGIGNCKKIYGNKFDKLISNVNDFSPELSEWLILEGYGKVLGRKSFSLKDRELCIVAILCSMKFESQLYSHINGAYRLNNSLHIIKLVIVSLEHVGGMNIKTFGLEVFNEFIKTKCPKGLGL
jgi:alkylhydroperoxidase/carboxymuconolactone decarboxylase family protein YurZ